MEPLEREDEICPSCQGRLTTPEGKPCYCILARSVKGFLPGSLSSYDWGRSFLDFKLPDRRTPLSAKIEEKNLLFWNSSEYRFYGTIKTWLVHQYLRTAGKLTFQLSSAYRLIDSLYKEASARTEEDYLYKDFVEFDLLFLCLGFDPPNKTYGEAIITLLQDRGRLEHRTWIWVAPAVTQSSFQDKYGNDLFNYLTNGTFSNFIMVESASFSKASTVDAADPVAQNGNTTTTQMNVKTYR